MADAGPARGRDTSRCSRRRASGTELIAADADGRESDGHPVILMTRLPGRPDVTRAYPEGWLRQIAATAVRIHDVQAAAGPFEAWIDAAAFTTNG